MKRERYLWPKHSTLTLGLIFTTVDLHCTRRQNTILQKSVISPTALRIVGVLSMLVEGDPVLLSGSAGLKSSDPVYSKAIAH